MLTCHPGERAPSRRASFPPEGRLWKGGAAPEDGLEPCPVMLVGPTDLPERGSWGSPGVGGEGLGFV